MKKEEEEEKRRERMNRAHREHEAWPVAFCLARIEVEGGDDGKRMKRGKRARRREGVREAAGAQRGITWRGFEINSR